MTASDRPARPEPLWRDLLGEHLRDVRRRRGDTLQAVARRANLSTQYLSEVERGRKEASSEVIGAVAGALGLTLLDLTLGVAGRLHDARSTAAPTRGTVALAA